MTKEEVLKALGNVIDPDLHKDLVTLNMIQDISIEGKNLSFTLVLTTPACPLKDELKQNCIDAIHKHLGEDILVQVTLSSLVTTRRKESDAVLKDVRNIIAVGSGKGGVGKSTVAVNLAIALARTGARVGLIDADIYGPSIPIMFGLTNHRPSGHEEGEKMIIDPVKKYGIKLISIGFFVDQSKALIWRGPMASTAMRQLFTDVQWGELDYLIIDLPPGTGDIPLTLIQDFPVTGAVIVSTPQQLALADVRKATDMFRNEKIHIPILGMVENMAFFIPPDAPDKRYYIFGKEGGKAFSKELNIHLLGEIPIEAAITESGDSGKPVAVDPSSPVTSAFDRLAEEVARQVAITNAISETFHPKQS